MRERLLAVGLVAAMPGPTSDCSAWGANLPQATVQRPAASAIPVASPIVEGSCTGAWLRGEAFLAQWGVKGPAVLKAACERAVLKVAREERCDLVDGAVIAIASKPGNVITLVNCKSGQQMRQISVKD